MARADGWRGVAVTCVVLWRAAHSTLGGWRRLVSVGRCRPYLPRCLVHHRPEECPACEGSGGRLLDDWGYERDDCRACGGTGLRTVSR